MERTKFCLKFLCVKQKDSFVPRPNMGAQSVPCGPQDLPDAAWAAVGANERYDRAATMQPDPY